MDALDANLKEFENQNHSQIDKVRARHKQVQATWFRLNRLKARKENSLKGANEVELFNKVCEEAADWLMEKMEQLDTAVLGHDLKTVQALKRRHDNLERELTPVEEKVNTVNSLANTVQQNYPNETKNVQKKQKEIDNLWQKVREKAVGRRARLENAVGQQIFTNSTNALLAWIANVKNRLNADDTVRDVQTAEAMLKDHQELGQEIKANDDE